ncbi:hypothetical protein PNE09_08855 [[Eubacterium] siraeum]|uniref:Bacterial SH3 domain n=1 Tax=[Eubacterium] siraeum TaxID=39492 RepID=A0AAW6D5L7_9FIRM|nr:hypothetical protein [[Eubacterium] siraeum]MDB8004173.1 hypothetical protein [[Eubacterium] siraeum]
MKIKKHVTLTAVVLSAIILAVGCSADSNNSATSTTSVTPETTPAVTTTAKPVEQTTVTTTTTKKQETNKPVETTTTTTTVVTTTTKPAPEWTEEKVSATKYVNTDCYSRKKAVLGAETVKIYNVNDKVKVVAKTNTGYFKLGTGAFIHGDYLSNNKVTVQTTTTTVATTKKPTENKPLNEDTPNYGAIPEPWTEEDIWYVFDTVEKYAKSKGYNGCDFSRKITHYSDELGLWSFGEFGDYSVVGKVWAYGSTGADEFVFYKSYDKKKNIDYFINMMKKSVDTCISHVFPDSDTFKVTVATGNDLLKLYAHEGMTQEEYPEDEIFNCDPDRVYVFFWNH